MAEQAIPTVVVDDLHIVYRVYGASSRKGNATTALRRIVRRQSAPTMREVHAVRGIVLRRLPGRRHRPHRPQRVGQVDAAAGDRRPAAGRPRRGLHRGPAVAARRQRRADERPDRRAQRRAGLPGHGHDPRRRSATAHDEIVEFAGIGDFISLPMRTYSSGMGARLRFAIAAAKTHDVLLIDEALATGDASFAQERGAHPRAARGRRHGVPRQPLAVVVRETCNRVIWLDDGEIVMDGPVDEVLAPTRPSSTPTPDRPAARARSGPPRP